MSFMRSFPAGAHLVFYTLHTIGEGERGLALWHLGDGFLALKGSARFGESFFSHVGFWDRCLVQQSSSNTLCCQLEMVVFSRTWVVWERRVEWVTSSFGVMSAFVKRVATFLRLNQKRKRMG